MLYVRIQLGHTLVSARLHRDGLFLDRIQAIRVVNGEIPGPGIVTRPSQLQVGDGVRLPGGFKVVVHVRWLLYLNSGLPSIKRAVSTVREFDLNRQVELEVSVVLKETFYCTLGFDLGLLHFKDFFVLLEE